MVYCNNKTIPPGPKTVSWPYFEAQIEVFVPDLDLIYFIT